MAKRGKGSELELARAGEAVHGREGAVALVFGAAIDVESSRSSTFIIPDANWCRFGRFSGGVIELFPDDIAAAVEGRCGVRAGEEEVVRGSGDVCKNGLDS